MSSLGEIHKNAPVCRSKATRLRGGFADTQPAGRQRLLRRRREDFESVFYNRLTEFREPHLASLGSQIIVEAGSKLGVGLQIHSNIPRAFSPASSSGSTIPIFSKSGSRPRRSGS